jgi:hypothetical protein
MIGICRNRLKVPAISGGRIGCNPHGRRVLLRIY